MPITSEVAESLAEELMSATRSGTPVAPLSERFSGLTVDDAYQIQLVQERQYTSSGRILSGRKIGLTSTAMQAQLGIDSPDFGWFFADMVFGDGDTVDPGSFISPRVEPEFAFVLGAALRGPGVSAAEAAAAVSEVRAAIEIIDSRIIDWRIGLVDTIADNASCGAIVLGGPLDIRPDELRDVSCALVVDGHALRTGYGRDVYGGPIEALAWLANTLGERGVTLEAGLAVLPGAFVAAEPVVEGTVATADFGDLGSVTVHFSGRESQTFGEAP